MKKRNIVLAVAMTLALSTGITAFAAPVKVGDSGVFDFECYAENNPDVVAALGSDNLTLWNHFVYCGASEGDFLLHPIQIGRRYCSQKRA